MSIPAVVSIPLTWWQGGAGIAGILDILNANASVPHVADWTLYSGGVIAGDVEISGVDFKIPKEWKLTFPEQSECGHTEGKILWDLIEDSKLKPGQALIIDGQLDPCPGCQAIMKLVSFDYKIIIQYTANGQKWVWANVVLR